MPLATYSDACREYARNYGMDHPEHAWVLTPWDTWERNPAYIGPRMPHPEDAIYAADLEAYEAEMSAAFGPRVGGFGWLVREDEIPF